MRGLLFSGGILDFCQNIKTVLSVQIVEGMSYNYKSYCFSYHSLVKKRNESGFFSDTAAREIPVGRN